MLKYEVDMGDKEMQQIECCVLEEFPPNPEPKGTYYACDNHPRARSYSYMQ